MLTVSLTLKMLKNPQKYEESSKKFQKCPKIFSKTQNILKLRKSSVRVSVRVRVRVRVKKYLNFVGTYLSNPSTSGV